MTAWETDDEFAAAAPRSSHTPPKQSTTGRVLIHNKALPFSQKPNLDGSYCSDDPCSNDGVPAIFDPHHITSTLHANLVSEILNLRRMQEVKKNEIESLESTLFETKKEQDLFSTKLASISKEKFALKRQLELIETDTSSAISQITKERDNACEAVSDIRRRLELAQKKIRTQDSEIERTHAQFAREKSTWDEEKRGMECRLHVAENRLKKVLEELIAKEANHVISQSDLNMDCEEAFPLKQESDDESTATISRPNSVRSSMFSGLIELSQFKSKGLSLADELGLDDTIDCKDEDDSAASETQDTQCPATSPISNQLEFHGNISAVMSDASIQTLRQINDFVENGIQVDEKELQNLSREIKTKNFMARDYIDAGIQNSPLSSPTIKTPKIKDTLFPVVKAQKGGRAVKRLKSWPSPSWQSPSWQQIEIYASPKRKNTPNNSSFILSSNSSFQSVFTSYPEDDIINPSILPPGEELNKPKTVTVATEKMEKRKSASTQTDQSRRSLNRNAPPPIVIPSIQLIPPLSSSRPSTELFVLPGQRDIGCQTVIQCSKTQSVAVQTDKKSVRKNLQILTSQFQSSAISCNLPSPAIDMRRSPSVLVRKNQNNRNLMVTPALISSPTSPTHSEVLSHLSDLGKVSKKQYGNKLLDKDIGPLEHCNANFLVSGGDISSDDDVGHQTLNDTSYHTPLSVPQVRRVPQIEDEISYSQENKTVPNINLKETSIETGGQGEKCFLIPLDESSVRGINQSNTNLDAHCETEADTGQEQNASSLLQLIDEPPFPIPTRNSSRQPYISSSVLSDALTPSTRSQKGSSHLRKGNIRKSKSATNLFTAVRNMSNGSVCGSSPPTTHSVEGSANADIPPLENSRINSPTQRSLSNYENQSHYRASSNNSDSLGSISSTSTRTSIVSAIAETMIGEWLYKYTRHKSHGINDAGFDIDGSSGSRHKRWVWVAPYERAVMWSSRQPTSDSALMGKGGRKLTIQSVHDVKDENPAPKSVCLFHRSILILTPVRALRITASTAERHQTWMTALSFLAHSKGVTSRYPPNSMDPLESKSQLSASRHHKPSDRVNKSKNNTTPRSGAAFNQPIQRVTDDDPYFAADAWNSCEDTSPAADAPVVPRLTHRSVSYHTNTSPISLISHCQRSNNNYNGSGLSINRAIPGQIGLNHTAASILAAASTVGLSVAASESSDIYAYNACPILPTAVRTNSTNPYSFSPMKQENYGNGNSIKFAASSTELSQFDQIGTVCMQAFVSSRSSLDAYIDHGSRNCSIVDDELEQKDLKKWIGNETRKDKAQQWHEHFNKDAYMCFDETKIITEKGFEDQCAFPRGENIELFRGF